MDNLIQDVALLEKRKQASKTWMLLNTNGDAVVLEVDKYAIMQRAGIHARDLRILDPLLSYPSTILGRERAIVLNLEHIKAIITAEEVLLRDPTNELVIPLVKELSRRLPIQRSDSSGHEGSEGEGINLDDIVSSTIRTNYQGDQDDNISGSDVPPFEFRALEVALVSICSFLDAQTIELENNANPALEELARKISSRNLDHVRKLKSRMTRLTARVQKVKSELEQLLDDDDDMADLFLTRRKFEASSPFSSFREPTMTIASSLNRGPTNSDDIDELEMLLEAYFTQIESTLNKLIALREFIDDTEDYINIQLDSRRNKLIQLDLILSSAIVVVTMFSLVTAIFGMNIPYRWNHGHSESFKWVLVVTTSICLVIFTTMMGYARHKQLIGT